MSGSLEGKKGVLVDIFHFVAPTWVYVSLTFLVALPAIFVIARSVINAITLMPWQWLDDLMDVAGRFFFSVSGYTYLITACFVLAFSAPAWGVWTAGIMAVLGTIVAFTQGASDNLPEC
jgi:hypothetical protein